MTSVVSAADGYGQVREFQSTTEGFRQCRLEGADSLPFVVRTRLGGSCSQGVETWPNLEKVRQQIRFENKITGYDCFDTPWTKSGKEILALFDADCLHFNVIDSQSTRGSTSLLSPNMASVMRGSPVDESMWLSYVISPRSTQCGPLHEDPPFGSVWQRIVSGSKIWYCLDKKKFDLASFNTNRKLTELNVEQRQTHGLGKSRPPPPDMISLAQENFVYRVVLNAGDFISVPTSWPHAVETTTKSVGVAGYGPVPEDVAAH